MSCIKILTDEDFGLESISFNNPRIRYGARGIVINKDGNIAIINKQLKNEYKLAGGGIEEDELPDEAFKREVFEETGAKLKNIWLVGTIEEHKSQDNFKQISYVYCGKVTELEEPNYTEKEIGEGAKLLWLSIDEAMSKIKDCESKILASTYESNKSIYHTKFVVRRDYEILKYYKKNFEE